jgi:hypothetical protein
MSELKLTEWFPGFIKPVRMGWYETAAQTPLGIIRGYSFWSGKQWSNTRSALGGVKTYDGAEQYKKWRGIDRS